MSSKNKKHYCKYHVFGCGGSCYGKGRMEKHEATCKYAPQNNQSTAPAGMLARFETMESTISMLVRRCTAQEKTNKKQAAEIRSLKAQVAELHTTVKRLTPDYSHIELTLLHLPQYIMERVESREWVEALKARCKYRNPKYLFTAFMQKLLEEEPFFFKMKSYDVVTVTTCFGRKVLRDHDMPLRDFAVEFYSVCYVLMTCLWRGVEEVNKAPFLPHIMCRGYSEEHITKLERRNKMVQAQHAKTHALELHQAWVASIDSFCDWVRDSFTEKVNNSLVSRPRQSLKTLTL